MLIHSLVIWLVLACVCSQQEPAKAVDAARDLIRQNRYNDAISKLEEVLETTPAHAEALSYLGTAYLYREKDFLKAKKLFEESFRAGGGASFWVNHSHEKLGTDELADYCRGWLYLRKGEVEFAPENGEHSFRLPYSNVKELKQNRLGRSFFHIKDENKNFNFQPRTRDEGEVQLIVIMYRNFSR